MNASPFIIRNAEPDEFTQIGDLLVSVYSNLDGFPKPSEQPAYYNKIRNVGDFTKQPKAELLVAVSSAEKILGAVIYCGDMRFYGSGGAGTTETDAAGFRLLAVNPNAQGQGVGKALTRACIEKAKNQNCLQIILHSTNAMQIAWQMYQKLGFKRSEDLDFMQGDLGVFGFRLLL